MPQPAARQPARRPAASNTSDNAARQTSGDLLQFRYAPRQPTVAHIPIRKRQLPQQHRCPHWTTYRRRGPLQKLTPPYTSSVRQQLRQPVQQRLRHRPQRLLRIRRSRIINCHADQIRNRIGANAELRCDIRPRRAGVLQFQSTAAQTLALGTGRSNRPSPADAQPRHAPASAYNSPDTPKPHKQSPVPIYSHRSPAGTAARHAWPAAGQRAKPANPRRRWHSKPPCTCQSAIRSLSRHSTG